MRRSLSLVLAWLFLLTTTATAADPPIVLHNGNTVRLPSATALQVQAPTTANASINMPHGTAPSAPTNGDCWTTTTGLFCRINGVTKGPYADGVGTIGGGTGSTDNAIIRADGTGGATIQGGSSVTISDIGAFTFPDGVRQTFNPDGTNAGLNVGSQAGDPGSPSNGDLWYDSTANELTGRINGANVALGGGTTNNYYAGATTVISAQTLSSAAGTISFSSIPSGYQDVRVVLYARGDTAATNATVQLTINGDSGSNYDMERHYGNGATSTTASTRAGAYYYLADMPAATATSGVAGASEATIYNYAATTFQKAIEGHYGLKNGTAADSNLFSFRVSGWWRSTSAVTSLTLTPSAGNFAAGTTAVLYGIGGSNVTVNPQPGLPVISETVTSGSQSSVTVSSIPQTYRDIRVVISGRVTGAVNAGTVSMTLNGDSGSNYDRQFIAGNSSSASSGNTNAGTSFPVAEPTGANVSGPAPSAEFTIYNYANTAKHKSILGSYGIRFGTTNVTHSMVTQSGIWRSTSGVTSFTLTVSSGTAFEDGTVITVYGIGGSPTATLPVVPPQGRLTLTSNTPVMTADATAQGTIYYTPYIGTLLPVGNVMYRFSQLSYVLNSTAHTSGNLYDIGAYNSSGTITLCTAPAWTNSTTRSAAIAQDAVNGIWTNSASLTCNLSGGTTTTTIAAGQWTYLGTLYATANGQTGMAFQPSAAAGGSANILGLYNGYNRVLTVARELDSSGNWSRSSTTWEAMNPTATGSGLNNRISFVDGLRQSTVRSLLKASLSGTNGLIGASLDSSSAAPNSAAQCSAGSGQCPTTINDSFLPQLGFHYVQAMQVAGSGTYTIIANETSPTRASYRLELLLEMHIPMVLPLAVFRRRRRKAANDNAVQISAAA